MEWVWFDAGGHSAHPPPPPTPAALFLCTSAHTLTDALLGRFEEGQATIYSRGVGEFVMCLTRELCLHSEARNTPHAVWACW